ncbi:MAG: hypothetical protein Q4B73_06550 [Lachnospiraceae bacterium]|nr:hypothetical protein [Lachnospiraceae bacterium]
MKAIIDKRFFEVLQIFGACCLDYCLMTDDQPYQGVDSHRRAVQFALEKCSEKMAEPWVSDISKARATEMDVAELLYYPDYPWKLKTNGTVCFDAPNVDGKIPYWYAFVEPPCGSEPVVKDDKIVRDEYGQEDFEAVNGALFPNGVRQLTVYDWTTDWSDYFDAGHEWWGTGCWSIYDPSMQRYVVIMASSTD